MRSVESRREEINSSWTKRSREFQISAEQKVEPLQHEGTTSERFFSAKVSVKPLEHNARTVREQLFSSKDFSEACLVSTLLSESELQNRSEMRNGLNFMAVKFEREFIQMPGNWIEIKENNIISENPMPLRNNVNFAETRRRVFTFLWKKQDAWENVLTAHEFLLSILSPRWTILKLNSGIILKYNSQFTQLYEEDIVVAKWSHIFLNHLCHLDHLLTTLEGTMLKMILEEMMSCEEKGRGGEEQRGGMQLLLPPFIGKKMENVRARLRHRGQ